MKARVIVLLTVVFVATFVFGENVSADSPVEGPNGDGGATQTIEYSDPNALPNALSNGVWTCEHDVHHPHNSGHAPGRINVVGETGCDVVMLNIIVTVELHKQQCLWFVCVWAVVDWTHPPETGNFWVQAEANIPCQPGTYRGRINSTLVWPNGDSWFMYWIGESRELDCD